MLRIIVGFCKWLADQLSYKHLVTEVAMYAQTQSILVHYVGCNRNLLQMNDRTLKSVGKEIDCCRENTSLD